MVIDEKLRTKAEKLKLWRAMNPMTEDQRSKVRDRVRLWRIKNPDGYRKWYYANHERMLIRHRERHLNNRDKDKAYAAAYRKMHWAEIAAKMKAKYVPSTRIIQTEEQRIQHNRMNVIRWQRNNPRKVNAKNSAWARAHPEIRAAYSAVRRALKYRATPPWADKKAILAIYKKAREITQLTGVVHEVDHIWPLSGKGFTGLHVPWNLRIIPFGVNRKKSNKRPE